MKTLWPFGLRADYDRDVARLVRPIDDIEADRCASWSWRTCRRRCGATSRSPASSASRTCTPSPPGCTAASAAGRKGAWMPIVAEQHNVIVPAARLFYFDGSMAGVPLQGYHRYVDGSASMLVRLAALIPVAARPATR